MEVYLVQGTVTFQGKPMVGGGSIAFVFTSSQAGKTAGGGIQSDGTYYLSTYADGDGSIPGGFRVVVAQIVDAEPEAAPDSDGTGGPEPIPAAEALVTRADRIPLVYSDHQNSPLTTPVEATELNELDFDLKR